jgi:hypothetical protein
MDSIGPCPRCNRTEGTYYRCKGCGHQGCFKGRLFTSGEGCWKGSSCPRCGETNYEAVAYLSER